MTLDHAFVLVRPWIAGQDGREAADEIVEAFEAAHPRTVPLALRPRLDDVDASPFGIASRPDAPGAPEAPWPSTTYHPTYLSPEIGIAVAHDIPPTEPLWFHLRRYRSRARRSVARSSSGTRRREADDGSWSRDDACRVLAMLPLTIRPR